MNVHLYNILIKHPMLHFFRIGNNALWEQGLLLSRSESFLTMLNAHSVRWESAHRTPDGPTGHTHTFRSPSNYAQHTTPFPWHITSYTRSLTMPRRKHSGFFPPLKKTVSMKSLSVCLSRPSRRREAVQKGCISPGGWPMSPAHKAPMGKQRCFLRQEITELWGWQKRNNEVAWQQHDLYQEEHAAELWQVKGKGVTAKPRGACGDTDRGGRHCLSRNWVLPCSSPSKYSDQGLSPTPPLSRTLSALLPQLVSLASPNPAALSVQRARLPPHTRGRGSTHTLALCTCARGSLPPSFLLTQPASLPAQALHHKPLPTVSAAPGHGTSQIQKLGSPQTQLNLLQKLIPQTCQLQLLQSPCCLSFCPSFPNDIASFPVSGAKTPFHNISFQRL